MANLLVYIELAGDRPAPASLEALGEARRIASHLGATLYAILPCAVPPRYDADDAIKLLSHRGADRVIITSGPELGPSPLYLTHGHTLNAALDRVPPAMVILAATAAGHDLASRAAARLGAAYLAEPAVEYGGRGELVLSRAIFGGTWRRRLSTDDVERPIVVTLSPGGYAVAEGSDDADVLVVEASTPAPGTVEELGRAPDPGAALETARVVVTAGAGVGPEEYALVRELAEALGGEVAVTRGAVERGLDGADREIGMGGRRVSPRLYVACGASGSTDHLGAVARDAQIVAINRDPHAPIFRVAAYGIVGELASVLPGLIEAARRDAPEREARAAQVRS